MQILHIYFLHCRQEEFILFDVYLQHLAAHCRKSCEAFQTLVWSHFSCLPVSRAPEGGRVIPVIFLLLNWILYQHKEWEAGLQVIQSLPGAALSHSQRRMFGAALLDVLWNNSVWKATHFAKKSFSSQHWHHHRRSRMQFNGITDSGFCMTYCAKVAFENVILHLSVWKCHPKSSFTGNEWHS